MTAKQYDCGDMPVDNGVQCYQSSWDVLTEIYDGNGFSMTNGKIVDTIAELTAENKQLTEQLTEQLQYERENAECWADNIHQLAELTVENERLRERNSRLWRDCIEWLQLAKRQRKEMPNPSHNPLCPTDAAIKATERLLLPRTTEDE